jgi:hypothetical protein
MVSEVGFATNSDSVAEAATPTTQASESVETVADKSEGIDWEARSMEKDAELKKLRNDLKSREGSQRTQAERDSIISGIEVELKGVKSSISTFMNGMTRGAFDHDEGRAEVAAELSQVQQSTDKAAAAANFSEIIAKYEKEIFENLNDGNGGMIMDIDDPSLTSARQEFTAAINAGDLGRAAMVPSGVARTANQRQRENHKKALDEAKAEARNARDTALEETGAFDTNSGVSGASSNGGASTWEQVAASSVRGKTARDLKGESSAVLDRFFKSQQTV